MAQIIDTVKSTIAENFGGDSHSLASKAHQFSLDDVPDLSGKVAVVTGGTMGYVRNALVAACIVNADLHAE